MKIFIYHTIVAILRIADRLSFCLSVCLSV